MWILIIHILIGITVALYFDKIRYMFLIPMGKALLMVAIVFLMILVIGVVDFTVLPANREYYMKQWYYSILTNRSGEDSIESIAFSLFLVAGFIFSITYSIKAKIIKILEKRKKK